MGGVVPLGYRVENRALHVVEEHAAFVRDLFRRCNGALACLERGYRADAVLILEPQHEQLLSAQVGVIWFEVMIRGIPVHVANAGLGVNAIESASQPSMYSRRTGMRVKRIILRIPTSRIRSI